MSTTTDLSLSGLGTQSEEERNAEALLDTLARLGGMRVSDDDLIFRGNQMILPETMTAKDAINYLEDHIEQQEEETRFNRVFRYRPWDGAYAVQEALRKVFGTAGIGKATYTFFGKTPPEMRSINIGVNKTAQVPWGKVAVPLFKGMMYLTAIEDPEYGQLFNLVVDAPRKFRAHVEGLFMAVQKQLEEGSIYKGAAIDGQEDAEFIDLSGVNPDKVIYSDEVKVQLEANIWSLLRHSAQMRDFGMPLKRAVLLEGPYGTGKTLAAFLTARVAVENNWSFIYCRPARDSLDSVMATARLYQPSVVFFEDVDVLAGSGDRDHVTRLLDVFDGITAKGTEIMAVLTTNHPESIHKGMLRPGRLDSLIHIGALDTHGVQLMIEAIVREDLREPDLDYDRIAEAMGVNTDHGFLPAFVKESIDRTMRYAMARGGGDIPLLTTDDFVQAAEGLMPQLLMMHEAEEGKIPDSLSTVLKRTVADAVGGTKVTRGGEEWAQLETNGHSTADLAVKGS